MEVLPFVSFVLWATGLSASALAGLMAIDWYKARRARVPAPLRPERLEISAGSATITAHRFCAPEPPLRKAA